VTIAVDARLARVPTARPSRATVGILAAGCAALVLRPLLVEAAPSPTASLAALFTVLLTVGALWPVSAPLGSARAASRASLAALTIGIGAFAVGRVLAGGQAPVPSAGRLLWLNLLAAVAEEAFFRRLVYGALVHRGPAIAILGSAGLFAVVHVTVYGVWVLPLDLAAGLVLSWQRWSTGSWCPSALTHSIANVLVVW
jgi:membrane protease YdiL (CAAX protease family)